MKHWWNCRCHPANRWCNITVERASSRHLWVQRKLETLQFSWIYKLQKIQRRFSFGSGEAGGPPPESTRTHTHWHLNQTLMCYTPTGQCQPQLQFPCKTIRVQHGLWHRSSTSVCRVGNERRFQKKKSELKQRRSNMAFWEQEDSESASNLVWGCGEGDCVWFCVSVLACALVCMWRVS